MKALWKDDFIKEREERFVITKSQMPASNRGNDNAKENSLIISEQPERTFNLIKTAALKNIPRHSAALASIWQAIPLHLRQEPKTLQHY